MDDVGDADATFDHVATVVVAHADATVDRTVDDPRLEQGGIEPVARMGEVGLGGRRPQPGVDSDEQQAKVVPYEIGHRGVPVRLEFSSAEPHLLNGTGLRHSTVGERSLAGMQTEV